MAVTLTQFPPFHLGDRLRKAREEAGYRDAKAWADHLGISRESVRAYERAKTTPRRLVLEAWARECGLTVEALVGPFTPGGGGGASASRRCIARWAPSEDATLTLCAA